MTPLKLEATQNNKPAAIIKMYIWHKQLYRDINIEYWWTQVIDDTIYKSIMKGAVDGNKRLYNKSMRPGKETITRQEQMLRRLGIKSPKNLLKTK